MLKKLSLSVMTFTYLFAGVSHFTRFDYYLSLEPSFLPHPETLVSVTGAFEILLSFFLPFQATSRWACYTALFFISVSLPIDLFVLIQKGAGIPLPYGVLVGRIPFHLLMMAWAFWHSLNDPNPRVKKRNEIQI